MSAASNSHGQPPIEPGEGPLKSAIERLRHGEDAVVVVDEGREVAAVLPIDEYRRFADFRRIEDEIDREDAEAVLSDPDEEWSSWASVRDELLDSNDDQRRG